ncbi:pentapeptide repeat-containing protein [Phormidium sp. LEGE 05292]|uniref:pentapeptide repeat-containing protein n=1 Tax=[Phormidium] sp. LEGE 05292 TaxID=767427 RepID=UPI00187EEB8D|nr:serine/threonine-protein kinase [Phormidium sp. LEGE 05292]MBE9228539.1 pentapeptide repeat-containing protein [Phormidium sp. LEGE 05292]
MTNFPNFSSHNYEVVQELGLNREAGRITYLANVLNSEQQVVIKEFRFANSGVDWSGFKTYQREIEVLQQLHHPRIPRYLNSFETPTGFCLVQEYKKAPFLAERYSFSLEEIQQIAISVLEILVYLQQRTPPVIHRDIKPENILVDEQLNAYLVDFGFARIRGGELALSSVAGGTIGFMPPEEQFGRSLTAASDLYSLGATLICLVTGTRSVEIGKLIDDNYRFNFQRLVPQLPPRFGQWLMRMVEPNVKFRYSDATVALTALQKIMQPPGYVIQLRNLPAKIKSSLTAPAVGLATLGTISFLYASLGNFHHERRLQIDNQQSISSSENGVRRLFFTRKCARCDLRGTDLRGANLAGVDLREAQLEGADLGGANLWGTNLERASMEGTNLVGANLGEANLEGANLAGANLGSANLESASLGGANLRNAKLWDAKLWDAKLWDANLENANLSGANLRNANLESASLVGANLRNAKLQEAKLWDTNLEGANLGNADLQGAKLEGAYLKGANLSGAYLQDANLRGADVQGADLQGAYLRDATMPDGNKQE